MKPRSIEIHVLGRSFRVACSVDEEATVVAAARLLDEKMREIRDAGKVIGIERIALMAGLNLAHTLVELQRAPPNAAAATLLRCHVLVDALLDDREVTPATLQPRSDLA